MNAQTDPRDDVDITDGFDEDPYGSFTEGVPFAHEVISPALLAGLSGARLEVGRSFHRSLFELLDGVGGFDGLIVTPAALVVPRSSARVLRAFSWLRSSPAPDAGAMFDEHVAAGYEPDDASEHVTHTVLDHSLGLAIELGSNPSFTHASLPSVAHALLMMMASEISHDEVHHIETLAEVATALLAITSLDCRVEGGARVISTATLLDLAGESSVQA